ncbi:MAG: hypothetical protein II649_08685 [Kiritimatiellae bacterium]|nr:hypothetical protein [Kiritimatiellia bacterium]
MRPGFWQLVVIIVLVVAFFGGPLGAFLRGIGRRSAPPPPPSHPPRGRKVKASEDIVDAEVVERTGRR